MVPFFRIFVFSTSLIGCLVFLVVRAEETFLTQRIDHDIELYGEWTQGGLVRGRVLDASITNLSINQQPIAMVTVNKQAHFILGFGRDSPPRQILRYQKGKKVYSQTYTIDKRNYKIQRINGLPNSKVNVDEKHLERIYKEYALVKKARAIHSENTGFLQPFKPPLYGIITGVYGSQRILNGKRRQPHFGIDIAAPTGTPVIAPADGIVSLQHPDMFFSGGTLIIDHGLGLSSSFLHLDKILVKEGETVKQDQIIAQVGATGRVTGAHLDWRMNWLKNRVDPMMILSPSVRHAFLKEFLVKPRK